MDEFKDCLRPEFTELVLTKISTGAAFNVHGNEGTGKARLIEDLIKVIENGITVNGVALSRSNTKIAHINMKPYKENYDGSIIDLCNQLKLPVKNGKRQKRILEIIQEANLNNGRIFIFLDNFDAIFNNLKTDVKYDLIFLGYINAIKNDHNINCNLFFTSSTMPLIHCILINKREPHTSNIDVQPTPIPELSYSHIENELKRDNPEIDNHVKGELVSYIFDNKKPYSFFNLLKDDLKLNNVTKDNFNECLDRTTKNFNNLKKPVANSLLKWIKRANAIAATFKLDRNGKLFRKLLKFAIGLNEDSLINMDNS
ncbi:MAG: hypothetical protein HQK88_08865 [Nitrospirae bacterium]|nr:hypothetical protein [Nitrospirota bacterium]MBF0535392.1 hypothetical protein [Nitrospirota bacterium]MBF0616912.1 hypothetical protein [Nitrospirota bacterium]